MRAFKTSKVIKREKTVTFITFKTSDFKSKLKTTFIELTNHELKTI